MPYPQQGVFSFDTAKRIDVTILNKLGFIKPGYKCGGPVEWNGNFKINLAVTIHDKDSTTGKMRLSYTCRGEAIEYFVNLISKPSNLANKSVIWLMTCPFTFKACRKLYFNGTHFVHRDHIKGMYRIQTLSRKMRDSDQLLDYLLGPTQIYQEINKKHLKKHYRGVPTKKYKKLLYWQNRVDQITEEDLSWLYITGNLPPGK